MINPRTELKDRERDDPFPEPTVTFLSKYLINASPSPTRFPNGATMGRDIRLQSLLLRTLQSPQYRSPPSRFPLHSSLRERQRQKDKDRRFDANKANRHINL
jgi:hypothetical protein